MEVIIEYTRNKHAYAQKKDGQLVLRIPQRLSDSEKERVIKLLLGKVESKKETRQTISLFSSFYKNSTVVLWNRETYVLSVVKKRVHYALVDTPQKDSIALADVISSKKISRAQAKTLLLHFLRDHALEDVAAVVKEYVETLHVGRKLKTVLLTEAKTKWGSAHSDGTIRISLKTLLLPDHLFRYVCAHEATHLVHMNHGRGFWETLERICPNSKSMRKELHSYGY